MDSVNSLHSLLQLIAHNNGDHPPHDSQYNRWIGPLLARNIELACGVSPRVTRLGGLCDWLADPVTTCWRRVQLLISMHWGHALVYSRVIHVILRMNFGHLHILPWRL